MNRTVACHGVLLLTATVHAVPEQLLAWAWVVQEINKALPAISQSYVECWASDLQLSDRSSILGPVSTLGSLLTPVWLCLQAV